MWNISGSCGLLRELLSLERNVLFLAELVTEFLPDEVVSDFYKLADALFLPSREEGFGIPVLEAGLSGIPIFCADIPPLRDLGLDDVSYFSPDGSPSEIASMLVEQLSSSPLFGFRTQCPLSLCLARNLQQADQYVNQKG